MCNRVYCGVFVWVSFLYVCISSGLLQYINTVSGRTQPSISIWPLMYWCVIEYFYITATSLTSASSAYSFWSLVVCKYGEEGLGVAAFNLPRPLILWSRGRRSVESWDQSSVLCKLSWSCLPEKCAILCFTPRRRIPLCSSKRTTSSLEQRRTWSLQSQRSV